MSKKGGGFLPLLSRFNGTGGLLGQDFSRASASRCERIRRTRAATIRDHESQVALRPTRGSEPQVADKGIPVAVLEGATRYDVAAEVRDRRDCSVGRAVEQRPSVDGAGCDGTGHWSSGRRTRAEHIDSASARLTWAAGGEAGHVKVSIRDGDAGIKTSDCGHIRIEEVSHAGAHGHD